MTAKKRGRNADAPPPADTAPPVTAPVGDNADRIGDRFSRSFAPPELYDRKRRVEWQLGATDDAMGPYVIELNLQHIEGLSGAAAALIALVQRITGETNRAVKISKTYFRCMLTVHEWQALLLADGKDAIERFRAEPLAPNAPPPISERDPSSAQTMRYRAIYKLWPDFPVKTHIFRSIPTIKADAALRSFDAAGNGIVWAVIDSGIDGSHTHFKHGTMNTLEAADVRDLHRSFANVIPLVGDVPMPGLGAPLADPDDVTDADERRALIDAHRTHALTDDFGHGTHVAGIIAGEASIDAQVYTMERVERVNTISGALERGEYEATLHSEPQRIHAVAPRCKLVSLRVLDAEGNGRSSDVIRALDYVREQLNDNPKLLRVHGVNLSIGYEFDAEMFACGQSPICSEVNRLVQSGVIVVTAAGNTGYGPIAATGRTTKVGLSNTINDPGNAELAITVGATHRDAPHTFGVSYFSSKGPTGDGRLKPDLVAPGERIISCAAGQRKHDAIRSASLEDEVQAGASCYVEDSGTSMAAPHVSGAIAAFLSIRREFIGKPMDVKRIFLTTATPLGRERYFEGHGLVDLIRAIQSV